MNPEVDAWFAALDHPLKSVKYLRFTDDQQVEQHADELKAIVKAWITYKDH